MNKESSYFKKPEAVTGKSNALLQIAGKTYSIIIIRDFPKFKRQVLRFVKGDRQANSVPTGIELFWLPVYQPLS